MRTNLLDDLYNHLNKKNNLDFGECDIVLKNKIELLNIPIDVKSLLQLYWVKDVSEIGPYTIDNIQQILDFEELDSFINEKLIPIGLALNGDILNLYFPDNDICKVALVGHEEYYFNENKLICDIAIVANSFDEYLYKVVENKFLPIDFYSCEELNELKSELK